MLEVGVGDMTIEENRAHFSIWCMMAAPLIAGNDVRNMKPEILAILINKEAIAIDQDPLGKLGFRQYCDAVHEVWIRPLKGGDCAVCLLNISDEPQELSLAWSSFGEIPKNATIRDVWQRYGLMIDTHTADGVKVAREHRVAGVPMPLASFSRGGIGGSKP